MVTSLYQTRLLDLAADVPRIGRLNAPHAMATAHAKLCGSTVTVDIRMEDDCVVDFAHQVEACALGRASSSVMAREIVGSSITELRALRGTMHRMLKENGPPPEGHWGELAVFEAVRPFKNRHASTLLTFEAVVDALDQYEASQVPHAQKRTD